MNTPLNESFLEKNLNPYFLAEVKNYWHLINQSSEKEEEKKKAQSQLLLFTLRKLFQRLYLDFLPSIKGSVYFFTCVSSDGSGDYFALLRSARAVKKQYPGLNIQAVCVHEIDLPEWPEKEIPFHSFRQTPNSASRILGKILEGKELPLHFEEELKQLIIEKAKAQDDYEIISKKHAYSASIIKEQLEEIEAKIQELSHLVPMQKRAEALYKDLQSCLAIVHISLALNTFENPDLASKSFYFAEAGNFQGIANCLRYNWFSLGLMPFEEGLFLKPLDTIREDPWKSEGLATYLWRSAEPTKEQLYGHRLFLGYLTKTPKLVETFIYLACLQSQASTSTVDIVLPKSFFDKISLNAEELNALGVSKIISFKGDFETQLIINPKNKMSLRLLYVLPLPQEDFNRLILLSESLMGCTGDLSLSDCLINKKTPFYEVRPHKIEVVQGFIKLANFLNLGQLSHFFLSLSLYEDISAIQLAKDLLKIIEEPNFKDEWEIFIEFLDQNFTYESALLSELNRHFIFTRQPDTQKKEAELVSRFTSNEISGEQAYLLLLQEVQAVVSSN